MTSVKDFGAFVEILPGKDGLCHISELADEYVSSVGDVCRVGDTMMVKVIAVDEQDRVKLSRKAAMREMASTEGERRRRRVTASPARNAGRQCDSRAIFGLGYHSEAYGDSATESGSRRWMIPRPRSSG